MKKIIFYSLSTILLFTINACQDMLDTDSDRIVFEDNYDLNGANDPFYAISGILTELQKIGDRYVLLGELRGDLMTTSDLASVSLKEINNFEVSGDNEYLDKRDYYNVINNCNYAIQKMDTSLTINNEKVMLPAYAEIKAIRAWTYFQLGQIFGKAYYFTDPILDLESSLAQYPLLELDKLVETLIEDVLPYADIQRASTSQVPDNFISLNILLGDFYLYLNNYSQAALRYYTEIYNSRYVVSINNASRWQSSSFETVLAYHTYSYTNGGNETIGQIRFNSDPKMLHSKLVGLSLNDKAYILPTQNYINFMSTATYFHADQLNGNISAYREGDLRANVTNKNNIQTGDAYFYANAGNSQKTTPLIFKYFRAATYLTTGSDPDNNLLNQGIIYSNDGSSIYLFSGLAYLNYIPLIRTPHLYLRFAEAINRNGMPRLAFAVLKNGLTSANLYGTTATVNLDAGAEIYDFHLSDFDSNIPMAARGRGLGISRDQSIFVIPDYTRYVETTDEKGETILTPSKDPATMATAKQDSINWVELRILEELSAETPFEGNRFFDLLRISRRRENHPAFMAEKVAQKYSNPEAMKAKLMDIQKWFLP